MVPWRTFQINRNAKEWYALTLKIIHEVGWSRYDRVMMIRYVSVRDCLTDQSERVFFAGQSQIRAAWYHKAVCWKETCSVHLFDTWVDYARDLFDQMYGFGTWKSRVALIGSRLQILVQTQKLGSTPKITDGESVGRINNFRSWYTIWSSLEANQVFQNTDLAKISLKINRWP